MKHKKSVLGTVLGCALLAVTAPTHAAPTGAMLSNTCAGCHGTDGNSAGPSSPSIAGLSVDYFVDNMNRFKDGSRYSTIMGRIAKGYTEEEIEAMAEFFADLEYVPQKQTVDAAKAKKGEGLFADNCEKCHEDAGGSPDDDAGLLKGQWLPYLQFSMQDFTSGGREMPKKMKKKIDKLSESDIDALLHYFAGQH